MRKNHIVNFLILSVLIILCNSSCSHTPKGIDPTPLYNLQLPDDLDILATIFSNDSVLARKYNCELTYENRKMISIPATNNAEEYLRYIEIWQFEKYSDAIEEYVFWKGISLIEGKLYKEEEQDKNRYFMTYQTNGIYQNHCIPQISNCTILEFGFLLNKYVVLISYTDFVSQNENYKDNINNDILMVSELFNDVLVEYKTGK